MALRPRCTACGNLTRFDVVRTTTAKEYQHFTLAGEMNVDESEVITEIIESITCRWCQASAEAIEFVPAAEPSTSSSTD